MSAPVSASIKFLPAIAISLTVIAMPLLMALEPVRGDTAAAIFPPGWSRADVVLAAAEADTAILRFGALPNIGIIAVRDDSTLDALHRAGAVLLLPPGALGGCLQRPQSTLPGQDFNSTIGITT